MCRQTEHCPPQSLHVPTSVHMQTSVLQATLESPSLVAMSTTFCSGDVLMLCWYADLSEEDVKPLKSKLADNLFEQVPVGVGGHGRFK